MKGRTLGNASVKSRSLTGGFPSNPSVNDSWLDAGSGKFWVYDADGAGWTDCTGVITDITEYLSDMKSIDEFILADDDDII